MSDSYLRAVSARAEDLARCTAATKSLFDLSGDSLEKICRELANPLAPQDAVALGRTCRGLRAPTQAVLAELRRRHEMAEELLRRGALGPRT